MSISEDEKFSCVKMCHSISKALFIYSGVCIGLLALWFVSSLIFSGSFAMGTKSMGMYFIVNLISGIPCLLLAILFGIPTLVGLWIAIIPIAFASIFPTVYFVEVVIGYNIFDINPGNYLMTIISAGFILASLICLIICTTKNINAAK